MINKILINYYPLSLKLQHSLHCYDLKQAFHIKLHLSSFLTKIQI